MIFASAHQILLKSFFFIFKMAVTHHLGYLNHEILTDSIQRAETHHCAKFQLNWSTHYGDIVIFFYIFKDGICSHLGFRHWQNFIS